MVFFITVLRALAACLITNSHYTGIYPTDLLANGGLLGDVLFFAVSGYCLYNVKGNFVQWYGKRLWRIYPPVILITTIYLLCGAYSLQQHNLFWWMVFPTKYRFIAAILILYIPFYLSMKIAVLRKHIIKLILGVALVWIAFYIFIYDNTYYHIDNVSEPMILFLFFEAMLMGAYFRSQNMKNYKHLWVLYLVATSLCFVLYFASKIVFVKYPVVATWQALNQVVLFVFLCLFFQLVRSLNDKLEELPKCLKTCIAFVSERTLEIYVVQGTLINALSFVKGFPVNWFVVTGAILLGATVLHLLCKGVYKFTDQIALKLQRKDVEE